MVTALWSASVAKRGVAGTLRLWTVMALLVALVAVATWGVFSGKFYAWRANVWKERAETAAGRAITQERRANAAETSNAIATETADRMAQVPVVVIQPAEQSAQRIEAMANEHQADRPAEPAVDDDIVRELSEGRDAYSAAAGELRRTRAR